MVPPGLFDRVNSHSQRSQQVLLQAFCRQLMLISSLGLLSSDIAMAQPYVYPSQGQSQAQIDADQAECSGWASNKTGYRGGSAYRPGGNMVRGAAKGAVVSGIADGDAGKGAAAGAVAGGLFGGVRHQQQNDAGRRQFDRAYSACLEGRGYTVR
jgi:hypothetical protein